MSTAGSRSVPPSDESRPRTWGAWWQQRPLGFQVTIIGLALMLGLGACGSLQEDDPVESAASGAAGWTTSSMSAQSQQVQGQGRCHPSYVGVCIPLVTYDLDCRDVPVKRFQVVGVDPHGFDSDFDGIGCER